MKKNLVLIGMMGSGKSTIGKEISKKSSLKFKDTDQLIESHEKMKIREIFDQKGEDFFRSLEEKIVLKNLKISGQVVALGGGSFINKKIRSEVLKNSVSFWLNWKNDVILKRIKSSKKRPKLDFLSDKDILKLISNLGKQKLIKQASLASMSLPRGAAGSGQLKKGFKVFVKIKG